MFVMVGVAVLTFVGIWVGVRVRSGLVAIGLAVAVFDCTALGVMLGVDTSAVGVAEIGGTEFVQPASRSISAGINNLI